jgi:plastocyanin
MRGRIAASSLVLCIVVTNDATAGVVTGVVRTRTRPGTTPAVTVVYAEPLDSSPPRTPRRVSLGQKNKTFQPRVVTVPLGSTVDFPNDDLIFHNVFSLSRPQPFDLGLYRAGDSRSRTFTSPGIYQVFCNIHPQMSAVIVVAPTPYTTVASPDGRFTLEVPDGRYRLTALSERAPAVSVEVTSGQGTSIAPDLTLDESTWVFAPHKNKFGQDYAATAYRN